MGLFEKVLYYVIAQGIVSKYLTTEPDHMVKVIDNEKKAVKKRLRNTVTMKVDPVQFAKKEDEQPLSATQATFREIRVLLLVSKDSLIMRLICRPDLNTFEALKLQSQVDKVHSEAPEGQMDEILSKYIGWSYE